MHKSTLLLLFLSIFTFKGTPQEIVLDSGLVAYYRDGLYDYTGNGHHGTSDRATVATDRFGNPGATLFTGEKISFSFAGYQLPGPATTLAWWVKVTDNNDTVFVNTVPNSLQIILRVINKKYLLELKIGNYKLIIPDSQSIDFENPRFDFFALTYNGVDIVLKINNKLVTSHALDRRTLNLPFPLKVDYNPVFTCKGILDDVRVYNRALDDKEIELLYSGADVLAGIANSAVQITGTSAVIKYHVNAEGREISKMGVCWGTQKDLDTTNTKTWRRGEEGDFEYKITGLSPGIKYHARAFAVTKAGITYGWEMAFYTLPTLNYDSVTDVEGNVYKTINIGSQTWMAENLRTKTYADGEPIKSGRDTVPGVQGKFYYDYGEYYYTWMAATNSDSTHLTYPNGIQGACPNGWHIPNRNDFNILVDYLGGPDPAGKKLRLPGEDVWLYDAGNTNESGFGAKGWGLYAWAPGRTHVITERLEKALFWTSEAVPANSPADWGYGRKYLFLISEDYPYIENLLGHFGLTIRCLKDTFSLPPENNKKSAPSDSIAYEIYPNPASEVLYLTNTPEKVIVTIYDTQSRVRLKTNVTDGKVNIAALPKGVYFIHISDGIKTQKKKFVK